MKSLAFRYVRKLAESINKADSGYKDFQNSVRVSATYLKNLLTHLKHYLNNYDEVLDDIHKSILGFESVKKSELMWSRHVNLIKKFYDEYSRRDEEFSRLHLVEIDLSELRRHGVPVKNICEIPAIYISKTGRPVYADYIDYNETGEAVLRKLSKLIEQLDMSYLGMYVSAVVLPILNRYGVRYEVTRFKTWFDYVTIPYKHENSVVAVPLREVADDFDRILYQSLFKFAMD